MVMVLFQIIKILNIVRLYHYKIVSLHRSAPASERMTTLSHLQWMPVLRERGDLQSLASHMAMALMALYMKVPCRFRVFETYF